MLVKEWFIKLDDRWYYDPGHDGKGYINPGFEFEHNCIGNHNYYCNDDYSCKGCKEVVPEKYRTMISILELDI